MVFDKIFKEILILNSLKIMKFQSFYLLKQMWELIVSINNSKFICY